MATPMVDPKFTAVAPTSEILRIAALNAAPGQTAQEYLASRGGVNAAGYYGDSWKSTQNLSDTQYAAAIAGSKGGVSAGSAVNVSTAKLQYDNAIAAIPPKDKNEDIALYNARVTAAKEAAGAAYNSAVAGDNAANKQNVPLITDVNGKVITGSGTGTGVAGAGGNSNVSTGPSDAQIANRGAVTTALEDFKASLNLAGLGSLVPTIDEYIKQDLSASQIKINLIGTDAYKTRFPGLDPLRKAGLAINEATYISMERGMISVLKAYGLDDKVLGTTEQLGTVIANQVSVAEYENRVSLAADHVKKNSDVLAALNEYYGVDAAGAMTYLLNPKLGMDMVKKQVRSAEIGAAASMYDFEINKAVAESYINVSGTSDLNTLKDEFGKARTLATTQARLSGIEGEKYNDLTSVASVVGNDQTLQMESQRRALREQARFAGQSGVGTSSLRTTSNI